MRIRPRASPPLPALPLPSPRRVQSTVDPADNREKKAFGDKNIGFWGSFCLNLNNCMGPAMVRPLVPAPARLAARLTHDGQRMRKRRTGTFL